VPSSFLEDNWRYNLVAGYSLDNNGVTTEAEESPLISFVTGKNLVKTLQRKVVTLQRLVKGD
jgi:hypothetical protein